MSAVVTCHEESFVTCVPQRKADLQGFTGLHKRKFNDRHPQQQQQRQQGVSHCGSLLHAWVLVLPSFFFWWGWGALSIYVYSSDWNVFIHTRKCNFADKFNVLTAV
jgi:hypothetical protein